jgi:hypothetical protein
MKVGFWRCAWLEHPLTGGSVLLCSQGKVSVEVSAAVSENLYRTTAFEVELLVYVDNGLGAGLGRYDRHSRTDCSFRVKCLTAGSGRYSSE